MSVNTSGCFVDTNFLIAITQKEHWAYSQSYPVFEKLAQNTISLFITHTIRAEFLDYQRRLLITKKLKELSVGHGKWSTRASPHFKSLALGALSGLKDTSASGTLSDSQIKDVKKRIQPHSIGQLRGWISFCKFFLGHGMQEAWEDIETFVNYLDLRAAEEGGEYIHKKIVWTDFVNLIGETGLGSHDAMIINAFNCSIFENILTTDIDVAYSVKQNPLAKTAIIPDSMFWANKTMLQNISK